MEKILYKVQIGAYKYKANAAFMKARVEAAIKKRKKAGKLKENISVTCIKDGNLWKVQCGAFASEENAKKRLQQIQDAGYPKAIIMKVEVVGSADESKDTKGPSAVLACTEKYVDKQNAHSEVVSAFNKLMKELGHSEINEDTAWCTEFIVLCFYQAGLLDLIGYGKTSGELVKTAKEKGTWKEGTSDIIFGDIVVFHDNNNKPNHTEFALDDQTNTISGNYNGGVHKRSWKGRRVLGRIRPQYETEEHPKIRFWGIRFWENDLSKYGDAECFIQYGADGKKIDHVVLVDTGMSGTDTVKKLQAAGVKTIDAVVISHDHSDHYGYLATIIQKFSVKRVYLPDQTGVDRYMKTYGNRIRAQAKKCKAGNVPVTYLKKGDSFTVGKIRCDIIFQADPSKLKEKDGHHFINNMSLVCRFTIDGTWTFHLAGDCQNEANTQLLSAIPSGRLKCDVFKVQWHGDRGAISKALANAIKPVAALSNYHGKESKSNGRMATYDILRDAGCLVMRNYEDGEVYMDMEDKTMTVTGTKSGVKKVFKK